VRFIFGITDRRFGKVEPMRILILVDCYYPSKKSGARLVHDLAVELFRQGHDVLVVTPSAENKDDLELSSEDGPTVAQIKTGRIKGVPRILRAIREAKLSADLWNKAEKLFRQRPCDLIIFYSPTIFFGALVKKLKSLWRCPSYLILRDIFPQWAVDTGMLKKGLVYAFFRAKELEQYAAADIIGVQSPANLEYFARSLPHYDRRLEVLYNWMTLNDAGPPPSNYRARLGLQNKVVFFYGGNIGVAQDMNNIVRLAWNLRSREHIHFLLVGEGSEVGRLEELIAQKRLSNLSLLPAVSQQEYLAMLSEFDVGIFSLDRRLRTQNFPGKILGYMYFSMPIFGSVNPGNDLKDLLETSGAGLCALNGDDETLRNHALALADDDYLRRSMGKNARRLLEEKFSVAAIARQILAHFQHPLPVMKNESSVGTGSHPTHKWQVQGIKV